MSNNNAPQKIAYILFDGITWLDLAGVYEPVSKLKSNGFLPELSWDICGFTETAQDIFGMTIQASRVRPPLYEYDAVIVPGGIGTRELQYNEVFLDWLRTIHGSALKISVCTGSLLLGAAGFLQDREATTNFQEYENLQPYCRTVSKERIVADRDCITAGAVSASIDLGLYLCALWAGKEAAELIKRKIDYKPE